MTCDEYHEIPEKERNGIYVVDGGMRHECRQTTIHWVNGKRHRIDGPAVEYDDGLGYYWIDGELVATNEVDFYIHINGLKDYE